MVGWTDPEGARPRLGALLLAYYDPQGKLVYAGRVGAGISQAELERLWRRLQPLATSEMPLDAPPPRSNRFGSPLVLSRVHWVRLELVVGLCHGNEGGTHREPKLAKHHAAVTALFHCAAASVRNFRSVDRETRCR